MPTNTTPQEATREADRFDIHTGQECDVLVKGASDGKSGNNWENSMNWMGEPIRVWGEKGATHRLELFDAREITSDLRLEALEQLTSIQSIDSAFAFFYVCGVLAPPATERPPIVGGYIDLNDVMKKIGWLKDKPDAATRDERRMKIWQILRFFASARVIGERSIPYRDPNTNEIISTRVETAPWTLDSPETPEDTPGAAPVRVRVVISSYWTPLLTSPQLTQFMPLGELLGDIPSGKPSGDWARTIGLTLARLWRMKPQETRERKFSPTRRQLLDTYTPKTTIEEVLDSTNPKRAVDYYLEALQSLAAAGFIGSEGDAAEGLTTKDMLAPYGRQGWANKWLDDVSGVFPGANWQPAIEKRAEALPVIKPQNLKKRGRPRKK